MELLSQDHVVCKPYGTVFSNVAKFDDYIQFDLGRGWSERNLKEGFVIGRLLQKHVTIRSSA